MKPVIHPSNNRTLSRPANSDAKTKIVPLSVTDSNVNGVPVIISFYKPTEEELAVLNAGGTVQLSVMGASMMPVALSVNDFAECYEFPC